MGDKEPSGYTYRRPHRQRVSTVEVGEDECDGGQSLPLMNESYLYSVKSAQGTAECFCMTHQPHVIRQYSPANPLWHFFGRETRESVVVELASLLPEGRQRMLVFSSTHPGQCLLLVGQQRSAHRLWREGRSHHTMK